MNIPYVMVGDDVFLSRACRSKYCHTGLKSGDPSAILFVTTFFVYIFHLIGIHFSNKSRTLLHLIDIFTKPNTTIVTLLFCFYIYSSPPPQPGFLLNLYSHFLNISSEDTISCTPSYLKKSGFHYTILFAGIGTLIVNLMSMSKSIIDTKLKFAIMFFSLFIFSTGVLISSEIHTKQSAICTGSRTDIPLSSIIVKRLKSCLETDLVKSIDGGECEFNDGVQTGPCLVETYEKFRTQEVAEASIQITPATGYLWERYDVAPVGTRMLTCRGDVSTCYSLDELKRMLRASSTETTIVDFQSSVLRSKIDSLLYSLEPLKMSHLIFSGRNYYLPHQAVGSESKDIHVGYKWVAYHYPGASNIPDTYSEFERTMESDNLRNALKQFYEDIFDSTGIKYDTSISVDTSATERKRVYINTEASFNDDFFNASFESVSFVAGTNTPPDDATATSTGAATGRGDPSDDAVARTVTGAANTPSMGTAMGRGDPSDGAVARTLAGTGTDTGTGTGTSTGTDASTGTGTVTTEKIMSLTAKAVDSNGYIINSNQYIEIYSHRIWRKWIDAELPTDYVVKRSNAYIQNNTDETEAVTVPETAAGTADATPIEELVQSTYDQLVGSPGEILFTENITVDNSPIAVKVHDVTNPVVYVTERILLFPDTAQLENKLLKNSIVDGAGALCKKEMQAHDASSFTLQRKAIPSSAIWNKITVEPSGSTEIVNTDDRFKEVYKILMEEINAPLHINALPPLGNDPIFINLNDISNGTVLSLPAFYTINQSASRVLGQQWVKDDTEPPPTGVLDLTVTNPPPFIIKVNELLADTNNPNAITQHTFTSDELSGIVLTNDTRIQKGSTTYKPAYADAIWTRVRGGDPAPQGRNITETYSDPLTIQAQSHKEKTSLNLAHYFERDGRFFDLSKTVIPSNAYIAVTIPSSGSIVYYEVESSNNDISIVCDIYKNAPTPFQINKETTNALTYYKSTTANQNQETRSSQKQYTFGLAFGAMLMACAMIPIHSNKRNSTFVSATHFLANLTAVLVFLSYMPRFHGVHNNPEAHAMSVAGVVFICFAFVLTLVILAMMASLDQGRQTQKFTFVRLSVLSVLFVVVNGFMLGGMVTDVSATHENNNSKSLFWWAFVFSVVLSFSQMYFGRHFLSLMGGNFKKELGSIRSRVPEGILKFSNAVRSRDEGLSDNDVGDLFRGGKSAEEFAPTRYSFVPPLLIFIIAFHATNILNAGIIVGLVCGIILSVIASRVISLKMAIPVFILPMIIFPLTLSSSSANLGTDVMKYIYFIVGIVCLYIQKPSTTGLKLEDSDENTPSIFHTGKYPPSMLYTFLLCVFAGMIQTINVFFSPAISIETNPHDTSANKDSTISSFVTSQNLLIVNTFITVALGILIQSFTGIGGVAGTVLMSGLMLSVYSTVFKNVQTYSTTCKVDLLGANNDVLMSINSESCGDGSYQSPDPDCKWILPQNISGVSFAQTDKACMMMLYKKDAVQDAYMVSKEIVHANGTTDSITPGVYGGISVVEACNISFKDTENREYRLKSTSIGKKTLKLGPAGDFEDVTPGYTDNKLAIEPTVVLRELTVRGKDCKLKVFPKFDFTVDPGEYARTFEPKTHEVNMSAGSFVLGKNMYAWRPEILPFSLTQINYGSHSAKIINIIFIILLVCSPLSVGLSVFMRNRGTAMYHIFVSLSVFLLCASFSVLYRIETKNAFDAVSKIDEYDIRNESEKVKPGVIVAIALVSVMTATFVYFALQSGTSFASRTYLIILAAISFFHSLVLDTATTLPFILYCAMFSINCLLVSSSLGEKIVSGAVILATFISIIMLLTIPTGLTKQDLGKVLEKTSGVGTSQGSDSYIGETGNGACATCSSMERFVHRFAAFFHSLGVNIGKFFERGLIEGIHNVADEVSSLILDETCKGKGSLCHAAKTNACEFSYCIDPPRAVRMHSWKTEASGLNWKQHILGTKWKQITTTTTDNIFKEITPELASKLRSNTVVNEIMTTGLADWRLVNGSGAPTTSPHTRWYKPTQGSWIGSASTSPVGNVVFTLTFNVNSPDIATFTLSYCVDDVLLNATLNGKTLNIGPSRGYGKLRGDMVIRAPPGDGLFVGGANVLAVTVKNGGSTPNPMGLYIQGSLIDISSYFAGVTNPTAVVLRHGTDQMWILDTDLKFESSYALNAELGGFLKSKVVDGNVTITQKEKDTHVSEPNLTINHFVRSNSDNLIYFTPVSGLTPEQIDSRTKRFCIAHQSFLKSAQSAKNPTAGQKYCVQFHKDDDCKEVCSKYWDTAAEPPRPVTRSVLEKLDSRLDTIDDTQLQMSDDEFLRMLQAKTQSR